MNESSESSRESGDGLAGRLASGLESSGPELVDRLSSLIDRARESIASYANATLTVTY